jgi:hypothetical protein
VPDSLFQTIKETVLQEQKINPESFKHVTYSKFPRFVKTSINIYFNHFIGSCYENWCDQNNVNKSYDLSNIWTNYLYKGDFIPNHFHHPASSRTDPGSAAFILWVNIPYTIEEERKYSECENETISPRNGSVDFIYSQLDGKTCIKTLFVDKSLEGTLLIFPANIIHCVYPFYTSDDPRISISGNILLRD